MPRTGDAGTGESTSSDQACQTACARIVGCVAEASGKELAAEQRQAAEDDCVAQCKRASQETIEQVVACLRHDRCNEFADCVEAIDLRPR